MKIDHVQNCTLTLICSCCGSRHPRSIIVSHLARLTVTSLCVVLTHTPCVHLQISEQQPPLLIMNASANFSAQMTLRLPYQLPAFHQLQEYSCQHGHCTDRSPIFATLRLSNTESVVLRSQAPQTDQVIAL